MTFRKTAITAFCCVWLTVFVTVAIGEDRANEGLSQEAQVSLERLIESLEALKVSPENLDSLHEQLRGEDPRPQSDHWAFQTPTRPELPSVAREGWSENGIDSFILARLDKEGLEPSPFASKENLIRRVSLDLIGLPPTPEEVDEFLNDESPDAYEKVVDRLLASPHYGERQAQFWLDLARYADTQGYHIDTPRDMWAYRDWVIDAFNRDLPFDEFTIEQLAGDLLPNPRRDQIIATGFHRNTMFNEEGGVDVEEFRTRAIVDRVGTTATVWLGLTLACAECHDHKYDPLTQRDFYSLYAIFNNTKDLGGGTHASRAPLVHLLSEEQESELEKVRSQIAGLQDELKTPTEALEEEQTDWEKRNLQGIEWEPLIPETKIAESGALLETLYDASILALGPAAATDVYTLSTDTRLQRITAIKLEILNHDSLPSGGKSRHANGSAGVTHLSVRIGSTSNPQSATEVVLAHPSENEFKEDWKASLAIDKNVRSGWVVDGTGEDPATAIFEVKGATAFSSGTHIGIAISQNYGLDSTLGRFRLSATSGPLPIRVLPSDVDEILAVTATERSQGQSDRIASYFREIAPSLDPVRERLADSQMAEAAILKSASTTLVMGEMEKGRETYIHVRGNFQNSGAKVFPAVPAVFKPLPEKEEPNRLTLANWLVDPENPLTARVTMNRLWEQFFGRGLVETSEDFGVRSSDPSHPELLDWLATEFIRQGWSQKAMRKLLVMSGAYRQSTQVSPELLEKDPYNRLLARGPRFRLDAEAIRDNALAVGGLLNNEIGGPSVFPYQPPGLWEDLVSKGWGTDSWVTSQGGAKYRRGLYTYWRRSTPYASFVTFDAPSREYCAVNRPRTNTPLQALNILNDPAYLEAAVGLGIRILSATDCETVSSKIDYAFRVCLSRGATDFERDRLSKLFKEQRERYAGDSQLLEALKAEGYWPKDETLDACDLAAWSLVGNVLLNLDETLTKG